MFLRAFRICSPEFIDDEFQKIKEIFLNLSYPDYFIEQGYIKARKIFYNITVKEPFDTKNILILPYHQTLENLTSIFKDLNIKLVFKFETIKDIIIKNSPKNCLGCVYEVKCQNCSLTYIGQTGKDISERIKQHKNNVRYGRSNSAFYQHVSSFDHLIDWQSSSEIKKIPDRMEREIIESIYINLRNTFNLCEGIYNLNPFIRKQIKLQYKIDLDENE